MSRRRFEVFEHRQMLARMRQGDSHRDIAGVRMRGIQVKLKDANGPFRGRLYMRWPTKVSAFPNI
jgi:hypothetical protein